eukprot:gnl/TRDRNA2_/TRDRNA2_95483_c0_seq2.p1 gnl/TRDRNA2_/TRDRNA2_95483_c0~~gnl/TRDRNA2_/TRDRNA2_95483_c0_seq2.p1  ORF type:complete len:161 (-),score=38.50 gnl/TRDRNA2_/TRDRNA2_95483_c0_seq2:88-522(-)
MDVMLSGRVFLADEAMKLGIVSNVFPAERFLDEVMKYATDMAINVNPDSAAVIKQQLLHHQHADAETAMRESNRLMALSANSGNPNFKEGVSSFMNKRKPNFQPLNFDSPLQKLKQELFETKLENQKLKEAMQNAREGKVASKL